MCGRGYEVVQFQRYLTKSIIDSDDNPLPLLNSLFINQQSDFLGTGEELQFKNFMRWIRKSPAMMSLLRLITGDVLSDDVQFFPMSDRDVGSGRNRVKRAKEFWTANRGRAQTEAMMYDLLYSGIGYEWLGKVSERQMREFVGTVVRELYGAMSLREHEYREQQLYEKASTGELGSLAKKLRHVASSTMSIKVNLHEIDHYIQTVGVQKKLYYPDEIIRFDLMPLDGKAYSYAPMESLLPEVYLMWLITQGYISYFENGGHPDKVFILPKEIANSKNHKYLIETLQKYKKIQNKHGNLVFTGELKVEDMMQMESQMEHKDLALYVVGIMALFYHVPAGRIPFLIGKAANNGDAGGLADSGYWRQISVLQSKIEEPFNAQLWNPFFGVDMKFRRGYMQDEVRETQNEVQKNSVAEQRMRLGLWTAMTAGQYLDIDPEEIAAAQAELKTRQAEELKTSMLLQASKADAKVQDEPDKQKKNDKKAATQDAHQAASGEKQKV